MLEYELKNIVNISSNVNNNLNIINRINYDDCINSIKSIITPYILIGIKGGKIPLSQTSIYSVNIYNNNNEYIAIVKFIYNNTVMMPFYHDPFLITIINWKWNKLIESEIEEYCKEKDYIISLAKNYAHLNYNKP